MEFITCAYRIVTSQGPLDVKQSLERTGVHVFIRRQSCDLIARYHQGWQPRELLASGARLALYRPHLEDDERHGSTRDPVQSEQGDMHDSIVGEYMYNRPRSRGTKRLRSPETLGRRNGSARTVAV